MHIQSCNLASPSHIDHHALCLLQAGLKQLPNGRRFRHNDHGTWVFGMPPSQPGTQGAQGGRGLGAPERGRLTTERQRNGPESTVLLLFLFFNSSTGEQSLHATAIQHHTAMGQPRILVSISMAPFPRSEPLDEASRAHET